MQIEILIAGFGALTTILGYWFGSVNLSKKLRSERDSESFKGLLESIAIRGEEIRRLQTRIDTLEAELRATREAGEREIRKVRKANIEQAQELAQFKARCKGCLVGVQEDNFDIHVASMATSTNTPSTPSSTDSEDSTSVTPTDEK